MFYKLFYKSPLFKTNTRRVAWAAILTATLTFVLIDCGLPLKKGQTSLTHLGSTPAPAWVKEYTNSWKRASIHNHTVWNFEWMYDDHNEMTGSEKKDIERFQSGRFSDTRNFELDGYHELAELAGEQNIDIAIVTEHNTMVHDWLLGRKKDSLPPRPLIISNATEFTTTAGHISMYNFKYEGPHDGIKPAAYESGVKELINAVHTARMQGGFSIMNHPRFLFKDNNARTSIGTDGIEVMGMAPGMASRSRAFWHKELRRGLRWTSFASSDWHRGPYVNFPPVGLPSMYNLLYIPGEVNPESVYRAMYNGHVQPTDNNNGRYLFLTVDNPEQPAAEADQQGSTAQNLLCQAGDYCSTTSRTIRLTVTGGAGLQAVILTDREDSGQFAWSAEINNDSESHTFEAAAGVKFVRAELWDGSDFVHLTQPVYFSRPRHESVAEALASSSP